MSVLFDSIEGIGPTLAGAAPPQDGLPPLSLRRRRLGWPIDAPVLLASLGEDRPVSAVLDAWAAILNGLPSATLVVAGNPEAHADNFSRRTRLAGMGDRLQVVDDLVNLDGAVAAASVVLDAVGLSSVELLSRARTAGVPVVTLGPAGTEGYIRQAIALAEGTEEPSSADPGDVGKHLVERAAAAGVSLAPSVPPLSHVSRNDRDYFYLFHHMPKSGGVSVTSVLRHWFRVHRDYRKGWETADLPAPMPLDAMKPGDLLAGHFDIPQLRLSTRYPQIVGNPDWRIFSIVRDPLELSLSGHFFENSERRNEPGFVPRTLSQRLREDPSDYIRHFGFTAENWREVLDRYWFIGTVERLEDSLQYIAGTLGMPMPEVPRLNITPRPEQPDPADVDAFARRNALDFEVYNEILARLDRRLRG